MVKKIALFLPNLGGGGAEKMMVNLSRGFAELGHNVDLVLAQANGPYLDNIENDVSIIDLDAPSLPGYSVLGSVPSLLKYLKKENPDILLSTMTDVNIAALLASKLYKGDTEFYVREATVLSSVVDNKGGRRKLFPRLIKLTYPIADGIISISEGVYEDLEKTANIPEDNHYTIYNPAFTPEIRALASEDVHHKWLESDSNDVIIGVGSLKDTKRFSDLIKSFNKINDGRLIIVGEGENRGELERLSSDLGVGCDVDFVGFKNNPYKYMSRSDLFVLPSGWEGFGNVIVEAMACGTPVVATDCPGGPKEILNFGEYGEIVPVGDVQKLSAAIEKSLESPIEEERLDSRTIDFHYKSISKEYLNVFNSS